MLTINSTYIFNICGDVHTLPQSCQQYGSGSAFQVLNLGGGTGVEQCFLLGKSWTTGAQPSYSLLDNRLRQDPSVGFMMTFPTGDGAGGCPNGVPRNFSVGFNCGWGPFPAAGGNVTQNFFDTITETNSCNYLASTFTGNHAGCPQQCPIVNNRLCGANGICGYDSTLGASRCFCNDNYREADCQVRGWGGERGSALPPPPASLSHPFLSPSTDAHQPQSGGDGDGRRVRRYLAGGGGAGGRHVCALQVWGRQGAGGGWVLCPDGMSGGWVKGGRAECGGGDGVVRVSKGAILVVTFVFARLHAFNTRPITLCAIRVAFAIRASVSAVCRCSIADSDWF